MSEENEWNVVEGAEKCWKIDVGTHKHTPTYQKKKT